MSRLQLLKSWLADLQDYCKWEMAAGHLYFYWGFSHTFRSL